MPQAGQEAMGIPRLPLDALAKLPWADTEAARCAGWAGKEEKWPVNLAPHPACLGGLLAHLGPGEEAPGRSCFRPLGPRSSPVMLESSSALPSYPVAPIPRASWLACPCLRCVCPSSHGPFHLPCLTPPQASTAARVAPSTFALPGLALGAQAAGPGVFLCATLTAPVASVCVCLSVCCLFAPLGFHRVRC